VTKGKAVPKTADVAIRRKATLGLFLFLPTVCGLLKKPINRRLWGEEPTDGDASIRRGQPPGLSTALMGKKIGKPSRECPARRLGGRFLQESYGPRGKIKKQGNEEKRPEKKVPALWGGPRPRSKGPVAQRYIKLKT